MNFEDAHFLVRCLRYRFRTERLQLKTLLSLNLRGGTVVDIGANEAGTATLTRRRVGDRSASLEPSRQQIDQLQVTLATLDSMHMPNLRFIKCDVEGHELSVFSGAELTIKTCRPVIQFEAVPAEAAELFSYFEGLGYSGVMFLGDRYLPCNNPDKVEHYKFGLGGHRDFLFFPPEAIGTTIPTTVSRRFPK